MRLTITLSAGREYEGAQTSLEESARRAAKLILPSYTPGRRGRRRATAAVTASAARIAEGAAKPGVPFFSGWRPYSAASSGGSAGVDE
jgi:hypothetical protein